MVMIVEDDGKTCLLEPYNLSLSPYNLITGVMGVGNGEHLHPMAFNKTKKTFFF